MYFSSLLYFLESTQAHLLFEIIEMRPHFRPRRQLALVSVTCCGQFQEIKYTVSVIPRQRAQGRCTHYIKYVNKIEQSENNPQSKRQIGHQNSSLTNVKDKS
jgi:hypothetical protein